MYFPVPASANMGSNTYLCFVMITSLSRGTIFSYDNGKTTVEVSINAEICFCMQNLFLLNSLLLEEKFHSKSCFFQHKIVFFPTSRIPSLHLPQKCDSRQPEKKKQTNICFSTIASFPKIEKCFC